MSEIKKLKEYIKDNIYNFSLVDLLISKYRLSDADRQWLNEQIKYVKREYKEKQNVQPL